MNDVINIRFIEGISFIVPTFNEENYIGKCLQKITEEITRSACPCEIILVDNQSTDKTLEIAAGYDISIYSCAIRGNPGATRNFGAKHAKYSILSFVDGDCLISENWTHRLIEYYKNNDNGAYGGPVLSPTTGNWIEKTWAPMLTKEYFLKNVALAGGNFSIRHQLFVELNGFNERLKTAEDDELSKRVILKKYTISNDSKHPVIHLGYPKTLYEIYKKQLWHAVSQLKAHGILGDKLVILTAIWLLCIFFTSVSVVLLKIEFFLFFGVCALIIPFFIAFKRLVKFEKRTPHLYLKMYVICWPFLAGRAIGLVKEAVSILKGN